MAPSRADGSALPLVLLPGMNCSADLFTGAVPTSGREVIVPRLDRPTLDEQVSELLDALPDRFALAGLSLGGIVGMALARRAPDRVGGLFLMATNAKGPTSAQRESWAATRAQLAAGRTARQVQHDLMGVLLSGPARRDDALTQRVLAMAADVGEQELDAQLALQGTRVDERDALPRLRIPVTVLCGDADALCPVSNHEEITDAVPSARLVVIPERGHLVTLEAPQQVSAHLADWLAHLDGQPTS